jgi:hypothetical protein
MVRQAFENGRLRDLLDIPQDLCREASECGFAPLLVLGGAFDGQNVKGRVLSYEAPFGIGYLVASVEPIAGDPEPRELVASTAERLAGMVEKETRSLFRRMRR